ncbi:MAG: glycosyl hydrolase 108 family protein [Gallionella sp.]|jgi:lysozyme family protein
MSIKFLRAIDRVLGHEGGYVNNPKDPGGETNWGISKRSYPSVSIKELTRNQAIAIYHRDFWIPAHCEDLSDGAGYQLLDSAVNSGIAQSIRFVQRAVGVADDGIYGPMTRAASQKMSESDFILRFLAERLDFMTRLKAWETFGRGWARRIAANLRFGAEDS